MPPRNRQGSLSGILSRAPCDDRGRLGIRGKAWTGLDLLPHGDIASSSPARLASGGRHWTATAQGVAADRQDGAEGPHPDGLGATRKTPVGRVPLRRKSNADIGSKDKFRRGFRRDGRSRGRRIGPVRTRIVNGAAAMGKLSRTIGGGGAITLHALAVCKWQPSPRVAGS